MKIRCLPAIPTSCLWESHRHSRLPLFMRRDAADGGIIYPGCHVWRTWDSLESESHPWRERKRETAERKGESWEAAAAHWVIGIQWLMDSVTFILCGEISDSILHYFPIIGLSPPSVWPFDFPCSVSSHSTTDDQWIACCYQNPLYKAHLVR